MTARNINRDPFYGRISFDRAVIARANYEQLCIVSVVKVARGGYIIFVDK